MRCLPLSRCFAFQCVILAAMVACDACCQPAFAAPAPSMEQVLGYSFVSGLAASEKGDRLAWVENVRGVRNIWFALATDSTPRQLTHYTKDDGQELRNSSFQPMGRDWITCAAEITTRTGPLLGTLLLIRRVIRQSPKSRSGRLRRTALRARRCKSRRATAPLFPQRDNWRM